MPDAERTPPPDHRSEPAEDRTATRTPLKRRQPAGLRLRSLCAPPDRPLTADGIVRTRQVIGSGRRKAAVPTGAYDNWGPPVEVTTWKQSGEHVGALGQIGCLSALGDLRLEQGIERILIVAHLFGPTDGH